MAAPVYAPAECPDRGDPARVEAAGEPVAVDAVEPPDRVDHRPRVGGLVDQVALVEAGSVRAGVRVCGRHGGVAPAPAGGRMPDGGRERA
jgi:hypothetical protein